ncbi:BnaC07g48560D [Brassica napus]|uniref:BnaC07g48560D protein n=1 Tax=Brassica napus TaxID=3708 RepID=A0A078IVZ4_BRANA|nr:BnaC07g48560D [Brassica napus]
MINAFKTIRPLPSGTVSFFSSPSRVSRKVAVFSFTTTSDQRKMDKKPENSKEKYGDVMSHSFGEGYATRSDEEGFGGTYGGNQSFQKHNDEVHENHPDYDKTQGSEAKEKERGRNQT